MNHDPSRFEVVAGGHSPWSVRLQIQGAPICLFDIVIRFHECAPIRRTTESGGPLTCVLPRDLAAGEWPMVVRINNHPNSAEPEDRG